MSTQLQYMINKEFNKWTDDPNKTWKASDVKAFADNIAEQVVNQTLIVTKVLEVRNNPDSIESKKLQELRSTLMEYFGVK